MPSLSDFNYKIYGPPEGRKWVFLHGLMGFLNNWRTVISHLESTECCLTLDQRGHGRSFKPDSGYAPEDYANDLKIILDELKFENVLLLNVLSDVNYVFFFFGFFAFLLPLIILAVSSKFQQ